MPTHPSLPIPAPIRGIESGSFAHYTVSVRLPDIGRRTINENDFPAEIKTNFQNFLSQLPNAPLRMLQERQAPDVADWEQFLSLYQGMNWLEVPWFFAETYFYRSILDLTGYFGEGPWAQRDPYRLQKRNGLDEGIETIREFARRANRAGSSSDALARMFKLALWSNQADLSLWPVGDDQRPNHSDEDRQQSHLLVDHSFRAAEYLCSRQDRPVQIDFWMDNAGLELVGDLSLASYLLRHRIADRVVFHLKSHPTFVSDAMIKDVHQAIDFMAADESDETQVLARRIQEQLDSGELVLRDHPYWTSPLSGWEMPGDLRRAFAKSALIVTKGDANYRRLLGDRHWPFDTQLEAVLRYTPAPLLALRVMKSEIVIGMPPESLEQLLEKDPDWMTDGNWAVIQFYRPEHE